jgi:phage FluMu gp28-like protein
MALIPLRLYQQAVAEDRSRLKVVCQARQTGKSFLLALLIVLDCLLRPGTTWVILSRGERQSKELMLKCKQHARASDVALEIDEDVFKVDRAADRSRGERNEYQQLVINFANGSRIIGLPANADTARGYTANVALDEFALHQDDLEIWRGVYPIITSGALRLWIFSTPRGLKNRFAKCWQNPRFNKHLVNIVQAVEQGLDLGVDEVTGKPITVEDLRAGFGDEEGFRQEYMCEFLDEATAFLTYELLTRAEHDRCLEIAAEGQGETFAGMDVGRKRHLSVYWEIKRLGDRYWTSRYQEMKNMSFSDQKRLVYANLRESRPRRFCIDATGIGMQFAEEARKDFGSMVEPVMFTAPVKEDLATTIMRFYEDDIIRTPKDDKILDDLHRVRKLITSAGNTRFVAEETDDGHSDRFWALALAAHGVNSGVGGPVEYRTVRKGRMSGVKGGF